MTDRKLRHLAEHDRQRSRSGVRFCEWYARCDNAATGTVTHPILGEVPICDRCTAKHGMEDRFTPYILDDAQDEQDGPELHMSPPDLR